MAFSLPDVSSSVIPVSSVVSVVFSVTLMVGEDTTSTLNSTYNEVTFNKKSAIMKENLCTRCTPFTYKYTALNKKPPIAKQNLCIFFFVIGRVECNKLEICITDASGELTETLH